MGWTSANGIFYCRCPFIDSTVANYSACLTTVHYFIQCIVGHLLLLIVLYALNPPVNSKPITDAITITTNIGFSCVAFSLSQRPLFSLPLLQVPLALLHPCPSWTPDVVRFRSWPLSSSCSCLDGHRVLVSHQHQ